MKRLHVHVNVNDLDKSIDFYSTLFGAQPSVLKDDYAKWLLDDPAVNFAVSNRGRKVGVDHLGIQAESSDELTRIADRLNSAQQTVLKEQAATCCYARSDKAWAADPQGVAWETFFTYGESTTYGEDGVDLDSLTTACATSACCEPTCCETNAK